MKEIYLDSNAHLPMNPKAIKAYSDFCNSSAGHGHPSSPSQPGRAAASALETARGQIAKLIGAEKPSQIIFTSTCTSACTWGLQILNNIDDSNNYDLFMSPVEHAAVKDFFKNIFRNHSELAINENGTVVDNELPNSKVACIHVQNEIGSIQPLDKIKCNYLFSDMSQSLGKIPVNLSEMNVDIATFAGHKFGGGMVGFIYLKDTNHWKSFDYGSRYFMDRVGTADIAGVVATATALENSIETLPTRTKNMVAFRDVLETKLESLGFEIIGKKENRSPNTTFIKCPKPGQGIDLLFKLGEKGIHCALGSACGSMFSNGSPLMARLGRPSDGQDFMRISQWGEYGAEDAEYVLKNLEAFL